MKRKLLACTLAICTGGCMLLTGCNNNSNTDFLSVSEAASFQEQTTINDVSSTLFSTVSSDNVSSHYFSENLGEIVDGIYTAPNGTYQISVPQDVHLMTAADTTTVFTLDEGQISITISTEENNGQYQDISQEFFESIYSQLYTEMTVTDYTSTEVSDKQTNYRFSFTGSNNGTTLQAHIYKAVSDQKAITIQISAPHDKENVSAILDTMYTSLVF